MPVMRCECWRIDVSATVNVFRHILAYIFKAICIIVDISSMCAFVCSKQPDIDMMVRCLRCSTPRFVGWFGCLVARRSPKVPVG